MKPEHKEYILNNINKESIKKISQSLNLKERKIRKFLEEQKGKKKQINCQKETASPCRKKSIFLAILLIVTLGFAVYGNSLNGKFIWDDEVLVETNEHIRSGAHLKNIFVSDIGAGSGNQYSFYRPFLVVTYVVDYFFWKLDVKGYHLTNTLLHILTALSIFWLIQTIFKDILLSFLTGVLFVVHPIHTEAVTYISGRADPLALLFMMLSFTFYIKNAKAKSVETYVLMVFSYALALLSKESSIILPVMLLVYHYSLQKKVKAKVFLSILGVSGIYILLRVTVFKSMLAHTTYTTTLFQRLPGFFVAFTEYIRLLFSPLNLHMEYGNKLFHWDNLKAVSGIILLIALLVYAFRKKKNDKLVFFSIAWFLAALFPVANLYPINAYMAEHWLYLPSIGFFLVIAKTICWMYRNKEYRIFSIIIAIGLLTFYSFLTMRQNVFWKDPLIFYKRTLKYAPNSSRVHYNLGNYYKDHEKREEAITSYERAIAIKENYTKAHNNLGTAYHKVHKNEEAIASYERAIKSEPDFAEAHYNLGIVYDALSKREDAILLYKRAIAIEENYAEAYNNLGTAYQAVHKNEKAVAAYERAIAIRPDYAEVYNNLGNVYGVTQNNEKAIESYKKAMAIDPGFGFGVHINLGNVYQDMGKSEEAINSYKRAIKINPKYAPAYFNLSAIYLQRKKYALAIKYYDKAKELGFSDDELFEALKPYR